MASRAFGAIVAIGISIANGRPGRVEITQVKIVATSNM
jgi:hypothetical protein